MRHAIFVLCSFSFLFAAPKKTALDRYIAKPDPAYRYTAIRSEQSGSTTVAFLDLTSQTWRKPSEVDRTEWMHTVSIYRPEGAASSTAFLFIEGGANNGRPPQVDRLLLGIANQAKAVVVGLRMVPNQPLTYAGEARGRTEDSSIVYTWNKFLRGGDEEWPLRLPMTKSAVRAMDAAQDFARKEWNLELRDFVVAGGSKRGWTAWTTAAVDKRIRAAVPIVIDTLNFEASTSNHWRSYGFWAPAVGDYQEGRIMDWGGTPQMAKLLEIEDPYSYRERLTMPKFIVNAAGDQFFPPDGWRFYFKQLPGENYLRYIPNADHGLRNTDAPQSIAAYLSYFIANQPRPKFQWDIAKDGTITVKAQDAPLEVKLWQAHNPSARDFRLESLGPKYTSTPVEAVNGVYSARPATPESGYLCYFIELTYQAPGGRVKFTTGTYITPDKYPFPPYQPKKPTD